MTVTGNDIEIRINASVEPLSLRELYRLAGWWNAGDETRPLSEWLPRLVAGSFCFASAYDGERLVGMGRAISDGVTDAYIQDVVVHPDYRRRGIGAGIVTAIVEFLKEKRIDWIGLIAEPGSAAFYTELGFKPMANYIPMLYLRGES